MGSHQTKFTIPLIILSTIMSFKDQKSFERFTHLGTPRFSAVVGEGAYKFLIDYR